ncbi:YuzB family protein [Paenibacillus sp. D2_2]|uniref:YuzB family protein n=1 Tax=Paenibacillus sp. D2_2 TaxID=3073092 RepID=UPI002815E55D|nr:YuzB family protein [Paenibacillus sp. D2_2]WMT40245.1 YuzB family protein [Paenibacillus sp. D2_2]
MRAIIEYCTHNTAHGTEEIMDKLREQPNCDVYEYGCLTSCGLCYLSPYALVNGESVEAETAEALHERIIAEIREIELIDD